MQYTFEPDLQKIVDAVKNAGYSLNTVRANTTRLKDKQGRAINAYVEPIGILASAGQEKILIGFFPKHEREQTGRIIRSYSSTRNIDELGHGLSDLIVKNTCRN